MSAKCLESAKGQRKKREARLHTDLSARTPTQLLVSSSDVLAASLPH